MDFVQILLLALVQALSEFLPISSSGHLVLASWFLGWDYQGIAFDLAVHVGTLVAVVAYFRRDLWQLAMEALRWRPGQPLNASQRLALALVIGTVPAVIVGGLMGDAGALLLRDPRLIGTNLVVFGLLLGFADKRAGEKGQSDFERSAEDVFAAMRWRDAILIGCAQALALVPGTSRSGITMTAGLLLGFSRAAAARFSFLLSVPVMILAAVHTLWELGRSHEPVAWADFGLGALIAAVAGYLVIHGFLGVIRRVGVAPFVAYRVTVGLLVLGLALGGF